MSQKNFKNRKKWNRSPHLAKKPVKLFLRPKTKHINIDNAAKWEFRFIKWISIFSGIFLALCCLHISVHIYYCFRLREVVLDARELTREKWWDIYSESCIIVHSIRFLVDVIVYTKLRHHNITFLNMTTYVEMRKLKRIKCKFFKKERPYQCYVRTERDYFIKRCVLMCELGYPYLWCYWSKVFLWASWLEFFLLITYLTI